MNSIATSNGLNINGLAAFCIYTLQIKYLVLKNRHIYDWVLQEIIF